MMSEVKRMMVVVVGQVVTDCKRPFCPLFILIPDEPYFVFLCLLADKESKTIDAYHVLRRVDAICHKDEPRDRGHIVLIQLIFS
jgi:hypothetical protein